MKKSLLFVFMLIMMFALSACGQKQQLVVATGTCIKEVPVIAEKSKFVRITKHIMFDWDSSAIRADQNTKLDEIAAVMEKHADITLEIQGFASTEGDEAYNLDLSDRRANAVVGSLVDRGVAAERIAKVIAKGETSKFGDILDNNRKVMVITVN